MISVLVDLRLADASGLTLLETLRADDPELGIIMLTSHAGVATAVQATRQGALDFLEKPVDLDALRAAVERAAELVRLRREVSVLRSHSAVGAAASGVASVEPTLERLVELAARNDDVPVLIVGETGTGKGYVARRIHERDGGEVGVGWVRGRAGTMRGLSDASRTAPASCPGFARAML